MELNVNYEYSGWITGQVRWPQEDLSTCEIRFWDCLLKSSTKDTKDIKNKSCSDVLLRNTEKTLMMYFAFKSWSRTRETFARKRRGGRIRESV